LELVALYARDPGLLVTEDDGKKPLWAAVASTAVSPAVVRALLEMGVSVDDAADHDPSLLLQALLFSTATGTLVPRTRTPPLVREKLCMLLAAGADPTAPTSVDDTSLLILLASTRSIVPTGEGEVYDLDIDLFADPDDAVSQDASSKNYSDHACSVFIADVLDSILWRKKTD
jgi:hypothetical protein